MKIRTAKQSRQFRLGAVANLRQVEDENGKSTQEMAVSISSEQPYERWFGMEVLSHDPAHIELEWLNSGRAPYLDNHYGRVIGGFRRGTVAVGDDKKLRGDVRFSRNARAKEIVNDIEDEIAPNSSVGYTVSEYTRAKDLETEDEDGRVTIEWYRATKWKPLEGSHVGVPADPTVGPEGAKNEPTFDVRFVDPDGDPDDSDEWPTRHTEPNQTQRGEPVTMNEPVKTRSADPDPAPKPAQPTEAQLTAVRETARQDELGRVREIRAVGKTFQLKDEIVEKALNDGMPAAEFRKQLTDTWKPEDVMRSDPRIGMRPEERRGFRIGAAIRAMLDDDWDAAGFEREMCTEARKKAREQGLEDFGGKGFVVPADVSLDMYAQRDVRKMQQRADLTAGAAEGVELVGTEHRGDLFIDVLRNKVRVLQAGAQVISGLVGNVAIPRQTAAIAAGVSESELFAFTEGAPTYDQLTLSPKVANTKQPVSQLLLVQGNPSVEAMLRRDLTLGIGTKIDGQALFGSGSTGEAEGIANVSGIGSVDFGEITPTWAKVVEAETDVGDANADVDDMKWIVNSKTRGVFKSAPIVSAHPDMLWDRKTPEAPLNSYQVLVSNQARSNLGTGTVFSEAYFGNWPECIVALWGGLYILPDPYTDAGTNLVNLYVRQFFDIGVRHPGSFARCFGIQNTYS